MSCEFLGEICQKRAGSKIHHAVCRRGNAQNNETINKTKLNNDKDIK